MAATAGAVYQTSIGGSGQASVSVTPTFSTNDAAWLWLKVPSGTTISSVADSVNGSTGWNLKAGPATVGAAQVYLYERDGMAAGSPTVTVTFGGSTTFVGLAVGVVSSTGGFDAVSSINVQTSGNSRGSGTATPSTAGLAIGLNYNDTNNNGGALGAGFSALTGTGVTGGHFWNFGSGNSFAWGESASYASGSQSASFDYTSANTSSTGTVVILFKDAGGGGGPTDYILVVNPAIVPIIPAPAFADYSVSIVAAVIPVAGCAVQFAGSTVGTAARRWLSFRFRNRR